MTLYAELTAGPLAAEIAPHLTAGDDGAIADILNRKDIPAYGVINNDEFSIWAAMTGQRAVIDDTATNVADPFRSVALALQDLLRGNLKSGTLDLAKPDVMGMAQAWLAGGKMVQADYDALVAMAAKTISRSEQAGLTVSALDIRREIWNDDGSRKL